MSITDFLNLTEFHFIGFIHMLEIQYSVLNPPNDHYKHSFSLTAKACSIF